MLMARQEHQAQHLRSSSLLACIFTTVSFIPSRLRALYIFCFLLSNVRSLHTCSVDELLQSYSPLERHLQGGPRPL